MGASSALTQKESMTIGHSNHTFLDVGNDKLLDSGYVNMVNFFFTEGLTIEVWKDKEKNRGLFGSSGNREGSKV